MKNLLLSFTFWVCVWGGVCGGEGVRGGGQDWMLWSCNKHLPQSPNSTSMFKYKYSLFNFCCLGYWQDQPRSLPLWAGWALQRASCLECVECWISWDLFHSSTLLTLMKRFVLKLYPLSELCFKFFTYSQNEIPHCQRWILSKPGKPILNPILSDEYLSYTVHLYMTTQMNVVLSCYCWTELFCCCCCYIFVFKLARETCQWKGSISHSVILQHWEIGRSSFD